MLDNNTFAEFLQRLRAGDNGAAAQLVRRYEADIRLAVRWRLRDARLRRLFDSGDVCQAVLATFFAQVAAGRFDFDRPEQLLKLLVSIARTEVAYQARRQGAGCRDFRRLERVDLVLGELTARGPGPGALVAERELLRECQRRLSAEEWQLAERRAQGHSWAAIAAELGGTPRARRMQLVRARERVARELGLPRQQPP
jgi:hypothetical protein